MTQTDIAAPLAATLAERGYDRLTTVQQQMLDPDIGGRDLLVSAQTGSGKTVAFGIAAAPELLDADDRMPETGQPLALAIAPTRELALQVAAELGWLYAQTGARIATCVGGMDYRTERRALARGAQIVVGTPGRLRDHLDKGALDLSGLRVAVLDEADEMLDLGFREDLEHILQAAPDSRRTLMFSATVPPAIEKLARDFQRDSLRVAATGEARQHGDITYHALSVTARDKENAIFNLLRFHEARTAIIFCKTRANVNHLLARMGNRGFRVVALSGELSQQERTHALQALRDGRARVCIATDVAARGIDLPGLDLVIHADLPTNSETLLHRSGRTGRAGSKGVSALIATSSEYKKAQRLLQGAKVTAEWGKPPSAEEVSARDDLRMLDHPALSSPLEDMTVARDLLDRVGPEQLAAAFVQLWREGRPPPEELTDVPPAPDAAPRPPRDFGASVWFSISVGHSGRAEARWLLPKICEAGGITRDAIGAIRVREDETLVQIATAEAPRFGDEIELEAGLLMRRLAGEPAFDARPARRGPPKPARGAATRAAKPRDAAAPREPSSGSGKTAPAWSPEPDVAADGRVAKLKKKARWSAEKKAAAASKPAHASDAATAEKGKPARPPRPAGKDGAPAGKKSRTAATDGKPASGRGKGRAESKRPAKPGSKRPRPGGNTPPRRPRTRG
ncbi:ATP-dependent RNA helicase DeaD [Paracoccus isoporae]|uniref:ATP-dependent RNA helicase DeaD n=1 Tax=Paracoccus isoporae TaxID=591205 RepID=A0A1G6WPG5_9RHOB|nr:DEAD/DEAH box helicase [Paracoccus isoporae]SDD67684.1 ATP-dependent RNA helicase DeaD [Paracoccus isoporae]